MIKIDLTAEQREKINGLLCDFLHYNKVFEKISDLTSFLKTKGYEKTSLLLEEETRENKLFLLSNKKDLINTIEKFNIAIKSDSERSKVNVSEIISSIRYGIKQKIDKETKKIISNKIHGFEDLYNTFSDSVQAYMILQIINVNVCPYCNRQYTFTVRKKHENSDIKSRPQFDHFFPKSIYPFLSISIYNLIPSCALCNQGKKDNDPNKFLYPYEDSFEDKDIYFEILNFVTNILNQEKIKVRLKSTQSQSELIQQYNSSFKLEELYNEHTDYISELLYKNYIFNEDTIGCIYDSYKDLFDSEKELKQLLLGNYEITNFNQRPLSKLTHDIMKQLNTK